MKVLDLFSGIGGFSLGLERAGMQTVAFCEIDPFCRKVLAKHWPNVPIYDDVRTLNAERLQADGIAVDVICGGFPCQPFSAAGKRLGDTDDRYLWPEYRRLIEELRPAWVVGENVAGLVNLGLDAMFDDLEALGYSARAFDIPACAVGAPHERRRLWMVAHPCGERLQGGERIRNHTAQIVRGQTGADGAIAERGPAGRRQGHPWDAESGICRVADGVPNRSHRLRSLGNAVVPQIPELIGRAIMESA